MNNILFLGTGLILWSGLGLAQAASNPAGHWRGRIQIPDHELEIVVDLAPNVAGAWIGSMSVTGTGAHDVPLDEITVNDKGVRFVAHLPEHASFEGRLAADGSGLSGTATNAAGDAPFQIARTGEAQVSVPPPSSALSKEFEGAWEGSLYAGNGKVNQIGLKLSSSANGTAMATLISGGQRGEMEIPVTTVTITVTSQGKELHLEARALSGSYQGTLSATGEIGGEWAQGAIHLPLTFKKKP